LNDNINYDSIKQLPLLQTIFSIQVGSEFENEIFEGLQVAMKEKKFQNTVVLSGLVLKDSNLFALGEFDFIVISSPLKVIIHIEAKRGNNKRNREEAKSQLDRGQAFFEENFSFPISESWNYIKMICFGESVDKDICKNCKSFIVGSNFIKDDVIQPVSEEISQQFHSFLNMVSDRYFKGNNKTLLSNT
jgi:hypothetical protein